MTWGDAALYGLAAACGFAGSLILDLLVIPLIRRFHK